MKIPCVHPQELLRQNSLNNLNILDTDAEEVFDELTKLASMICKTPMALISLVDEDRQWFKSKHGLDVKETERDVSFCGHAILEQEIFIVPDAALDERFLDNPLVIAGPKIRFYAGVVLRDVNQLPLGTLCVLDNVPRHFTSEQLTSLKIIAKQVQSQLQIRHENTRLSQRNEITKEILSLVAHDIKGAFNTVLGSTQLLSRKLDKLDKLNEHADLVRINHRVSAASNNVYELFDELLQWARAQFTQNSVELCELDIKPLVDDVLKVFYAPAKAKRVEFNVDIPLVTAFADSSVTKTIVRNFISNSLKYSPSDEQITIAAEIIDNKIVIFVQDNGEGIPEKMKPYLLSAIQASEQQSLSSPPSHGIGLYLCNTIAQRQHSRIWFDESLKIGTKMYLSLPISNF